MTKFGSNIKALIYVNFGSGNGNMDLSSVTPIHLIQLNQQLLRLALKLIF